MRLGCSPLEQGWPKVLNQELKAGGPASLPRPQGESYSLSDKKVVAILESMWDWRQMTSGAGYKEAPRFFRINPENFSGKRLYRIVGSDADLFVTNSCRELCGSASQHGPPNPKWLRENLELLAPFDVLLVCGKVAQATYAASGHRFTRKIEMMHPAARMWTNAMLDAATKSVRELSYATPPA